MGREPNSDKRLRRLAEAFGLSKRELAGLFGVPAQALDEWFERGVPSESQEKMVTLLALCDALERKLKPGALPVVARRRAAAYGGTTMLELIAAGREHELLGLLRDSFDWTSAA